MVHWFGLWLGVSVQVQKTTDDVYDIIMGSSPTMYYDIDDIITGLSLDMEYYIVYMGISSITKVWFVVMWLEMDRF